MWAHHSPSPGNRTEGGPPPNPTIPVATEPAELDLDEEPAVASYSWRADFSLWAARSFYKWRFIPKWVLWK